MLLWNNSISSRISRMILLVSAGALALACMAFIIYDRSSVRDGMVRNLSVQSQIIGANSASALAFGDPQAAENTLSALRSSPNIIAAGIVSPSGQVFARYQRDQKMGAVVMLPPMDDGMRETHQFQPDGLLMVQKIYLQSKWIGTVYERGDYSALERRSKRYITIAAIVLLLSLVAAWIISLPLRRSLVAPIRDLAESAREFSADPRSAVRAVPRSDLAEMTILVNAFNGMLEQIKAREAALELAHSELEQKVEDRTRQLIATNRELEAFSYSVSHDLRGPLETINGFAYMFLNECGDSPGKATEYIQQIQDATKRMSELIEDLLKLSHASSSAMHIEDIDLSAIAHAIALQLQQKDPSRKVTFAIADHLRANGDSRLLKIVLENLLQNAWKYTSSHPAAMIEVASKMEHGLETFFVRDDGAGFDPRMADMLFKPFRRLHSLAEFPGTGVGLATVQRILHRHEGFIWAEGGVEKGATFYFTIGARRTDESKPASERPRHRSHEA